MSIPRVLTRSTGLLAAFLLSSATALAGPAVALSPGAGPPTTTLTVSGTGYGATQLIDIYFDTTDLCLAIADGSGAFSCAIKVPKDAQPQVHWITAAQRGTNTGAQKAFPVCTDWPQFHGLNSKHTGFNPYENTINTSNVANLDTLWMASVGSGTAGTPAVVGGRLYINGLDGNLYAFANKTGATLPGFPKILTTGVFASSPSVGANIVYTGTQTPDDKLYAFNATTGAAIAGFPVTLGGSIFASPTLFGGNVYVACAGGKIYAFNAATAAPVPNFPVTVGTGNTLQATVSIANGRIFEGSLDHNFYAFDATSGAAIAGFPRTTGSLILSTAAIVSGQVFFGSEDHELYGVRRHDGADLQGFPVVTTDAILGGPRILGVPVA